MTIPTEPRECWINKGQGVAEEGGNNSRVMQKKSFMKEVMLEDEEMYFNQPGGDAKLQRKLKKKRDLEKQLAKGKILNQQEYPSYFLPKKKDRAHGRQHATLPSLLNAAGFILVTSSDIDDLNKPPVIESASICTQDDGCVLLDHQPELADEGTSTMHVLHFMDEHALNGDDGDGIGLLLEESIPINLCDYEAFQNTQSSDHQYSHHQHVIEIEDRSHRTTRDSIQPDEGSTEAVNIQRGKRLRRRSHGRKKGKKYVPTRPKITLTPDQVVDELMCLLLPHVDVVEELNRHALKIPNQSNHFPTMMKMAGDGHPAKAVDGAEDESNSLGSKSKFSSCNHHAIDLQRYRHVLKLSLFPSTKPHDVSAPEYLSLDLPCSKITSEELLEKYITTDLVYQKVAALEAMPTANVDGALMDVLLSMYRVCPHLRLHYFKALTSSTSERKERLQLITECCGSAPFAKKMDNQTTITGYLKLMLLLLSELNEEMTLIRRSEEENGVGGMSMGSPGNPNVELRDAVVSITDWDECSKELSRSLMNLIRSPSIVDTTQSGNADIEMLLDMVAYYVFIFPHDSKHLLSVLLRHWPCGRSLQEVLYLQILQAALMCAPQLSHLYPADGIHLRVFERIARSIQSSQVQVARQAILLCGNPQLQNMYISRCSEVFNVVTKALHGNSRHWNAFIREISDMKFDELLDFA